MGGNAPKRSFDSMSNGWVLVMALCIVPVYFLMSYFADDGKAIATSVSVGMMVLIVGYFWDLRNCVWFWTVITFIMFLHVLLVLFLPPSTRQWNYVHLNYVQMLPFGLLDFGIAYGIIRLIEKITDRNS